jgi:hypothetical protein
VLCLKFPQMVLAPSYIKLRDKVAYRKRIPHMGISVHLKFHKTSCVFGNT